jgi:hypothetical protein
MAVSASVVILALIALAPIYSWLAIFLHVHSEMVLFDEGCEDRLGGIYRHFLWPSCH